MAEVRGLEIDLIKIDAEIQPREGLDAGRLEILRERFHDKGDEAFPPIIVYHDADGVFWLADGHYRLTATREVLGTDVQHVVRAEVREGSRRDAIYCAAGANGEHGTQLTKKEMRRVVERLLRDPEWSQMGDRAIARHTGASNGFVSGIHRAIDAETASVQETHIPPTRTVKVQRRGKEYPMKIDKSARGRRSKAKTATTTTEPASPAVSQEHPEADKDEGRNTDDDQEVVEADSTTDHDDPKSIRESDSDDDRLPDPPKGFVELIAAWFQAAADGRQTFLAWAKHRKIDEPAGETTPEQHARYYLVGVEWLQDMAEAVRQ
jgi:hypothetical protein